MSASTTDDNRSQMTLIYAHRGASAIHPENTLRAFRHALAIGVDGIELDVHATADGIPVVIHDRDVGRTTDGAGYVDEIPLTQLETFDAGDGERVPTLAEVLELVGDAAHLDIEIKGTGIEHAVLDVLAEFPAVRWAISSFAWDTLRTVRRLDPAPRSGRSPSALATICLPLPPSLRLRPCRSSPVHTPPKTRRSSATLVLRVMVWTVNDPREAQRIADLGAFALCTDDPQRLSVI